MGKSLKGKELGKGISQRKDGRYQARFINRFGVRQTIYGTTVTEITKKLRDAQYEDEKQINAVTSDITLDEWFEIWLDTCKKNCKSTSKEVYRINYKRLQKELGWRKLNQLNLVHMQQAINNMPSESMRHNSKILLNDMLNKAVNADLITKNVSKNINTKIAAPYEFNDESEDETRALTIEETKLFLEASKKSIYYNLFVVALETGMRIGEITGLQWEDIDFDNMVIHVRRNLCYYSKNGKYIFELHNGKTKNSIRDIPMTDHVKEALIAEKSKAKKDELDKDTIDKFGHLIFTTRNNKPLQRHPVWRSIKDVVKRINSDPDNNFPSIGPHCFRHTFATRAIECGISPKTLQKLLGHSNLSMTMDLYCHVTEDTLKQEMRKFKI